MTFSITARCPETRMFGVAISSSSPAVAARCAHARAGVGAVATQNITDPRLGPLGLDLMAQGASAREACARLVETSPHIEYRQIALVDTAGGTAARSGNRTLGVYAVAHGDGVVAAGNLLASEAVPRTMVEAFVASEGGLGGRLLRALAAGMAAGGEAGPVHSAGLLLVREVPWPIADLRVDWHETDPVAALVRLWAIYEPQLGAYVARALDPGSAPSYAVPGDE